MKAVYVLLSALLCASPAVARKCRYKDYPAKNPGEELRGPTHTCVCGPTGGRWVNCRRNGPASSSSSEDDPGTIVDVAVSAGFSTLVTAVKAAGLAGALSGDGPLTVFAPTNEAFAALPDGVLDDLLDDPDTLKDILLYHVVSGQVEAADIPSFLEADTLLDGQTLEIRSDFRDGVTVNGDASVTTADVAASNGVIHVIDKVLIPEGVLGPGPTNTIVDVAVATDATSTLVKAIQAANAAVIETLSGKGPFTVFAPTNDAFDALPDGVLDDLLQDPDTLTKILLYHVVAGEVEARDVPKYLKADTLLKQSVELRRGYGSSWWCHWYSFADCVATVTVNEDATVVIADVAADNGVIHVIDRVLIPQGVLEDLGTIPEVATAAGFDTLVAAVAAAGLGDALSAPGPFTVFAPTDEAFAALPDGVLDGLLANPEALKNVLLYHVVAGRVEADDIPAELTAETLLGEEVAVRKSAPGTGHTWFCFFFPGDARCLPTVTINGIATVVKADVLAENGIIHVIDEVLIPPTVN